MQNTRHNDQLESYRAEVQRQHSIPSQSQHYMVPAQPKLEGIALDVLLEIMMYLEWYEVMSLRQVSTALNTATRQRTLWDKLIRSSTARFCLTKRIQAASCKELEVVFLKVQRTDRRWANPGPPRYMKDISEIRPYWTTHTILPGGRWLFSIIGTYEAFTGAYVDLNSPEDGWKTLIPQFDAMEGPPFAMDSIMDVDLEAEIVTFTIVMRVKIDPSTRCTSKIVIWRCTSDFDDDGNEIGLKAEEASTFIDSEGWFHPEYVRLRGDYLAVLSCGDHVDAPYCPYAPVVIDWRLANGCVGPDIPRICFPDSYHPAGHHFYSGMVLLPQSKKLILRRSFEWDIMCWEGASPTTGTTFDPTGIFLGTSTTLDIGLRRAVDFVESDGTVSAIGYSESDAGHFVRISFKIPRSNSSMSKFTVTTESLYANGWQRTYYSLNGGRAVIINASHQKATAALFVGTYVLQSENTHLMSTSGKHWDYVPSLLGPKSAFMDGVSGRCVFVSLQNNRTYIVDF